MEIVECLVMDDSVVIGGELCIAEHLVVRNEIVSVVSLECVDRDLHVPTDVKSIVVGVDSLFVDLDEGLLMKHYV